MCACVILNSRPTPSHGNASRPVHTSIIEHPTENVSEVWLLKRPIVRSLVMLYVAQEG
jgi:hypothetical protein